MTVASIIAETLEYREGSVMEERTIEKECTRER